MLGAEAFNDAAASFLCVGCERVPLIRLVVGHNQRVDGPRQCPVGSDLEVLIGDTGKSRGIGGHEFFRARQARQRDRFDATAPEVVAHALALAIAVRKPVNVPQFDPRH